MMLTNSGDLDAEGVIFADADQVGLDGYMQRFLRFRIRADGNTSATWPSTPRHLGGQGWRLDRDDTIRRIESLTDTFYTDINGKRADLAVRRQQGKQPYVQTRADGVWNNNLLALQECRL